MSLNNCYCFYRDGFNYSDVTEIFLFGINPFLYTLTWLQILIFNTNKLFYSTTFICIPSNDFKYGYMIPIFLFCKRFQVFQTNSFIYTAKWFQVLLCIIKNSIKHQSFVYAQLNGQRVLSLTIWFNISHLFADSSNVSFIWPTDRILLMEVLVV